MQFPISKRGVIIDGPFDEQPLFPVQSKGRLDHQISSQCSTAGIRFLFASAFDSPSAIVAGKPRAINRPSDQIGKRPLGKWFERTSRALDHGRVLTTEISESESTGGDPEVPVRIGFDSEFMF